MKHIKITLVILPLICFVSGAILLMIIFIKPKLEILDFDAVKKLENDIYNFPRDLGNFNIKALSIDSSSLNFENLSKIYPVFIISYQKDSSGMKNYTDLDLITKTDMFLYFDNILTDKSISEFETEMESVNDSFEKNLLNINQYTNFESDMISWTDYEGNENIKRVGEYDFRPKVNNVVIFDSNCVTNLQILETIDSQYKSAVFSKCLVEDLKEQDGVKLTKDRLENIINNKIHGLYKVYQSWNLDIREGVKVENLIYHDVQVVYKISGDKAYPVFLLKGTVSLEGITYYFNELINGTDYSVIQQSFYFDSTDVNNIRAFIPRPLFSHYELKNNTSYYFEGKLSKNGFCQISSDYYYHKNVLSIEDCDPDSYSYFLRIKDREGKDFWRSDRKIYDSLDVESDGIFSFSFSKEDYLKESTKYDEQNGVLITDNKIQFRLCLEFNQEKYNLQMLEFGENVFCSEESDIQYLDV